MQQGVKLDALWLRKQPRQGIRPVGGGVDRQARGSRKWLEDIPGGDQALGQRHSCCPPPGVRGCQTACWRGRPPAERGWSYLEHWPEIYHSGFLADARKEYTEANITLAIISGDDIPQPDDIGVDMAPYLNGMAEVIGELRRFILDSLRRNDTQRCEDLLQIMDEIYSVLVTVDFPEGVTGGLRRTTDAMRGVLERTRGDLTMTMRQQQLEHKLAAWEHNLSTGRGS